MLLAFLLFATETAPQIGQEAFNKTPKCSSKVLPGLSAPILAHLGTLDRHLAAFACHLVANMLQDEQKTPKLTPTCADITLKTPTGTIETM